MVLQCVCARNFLQKDYIGLWFYSVCCKLRAKGYITLKLIVCVPETSCKVLHQYLDTAYNFPQWVTSLQPSAGYFLHIFTHWASNIHDNTQVKVIISTMLVISVGIWFLHVQETCSYTTSCAHVFQHIVLPKLPNYATLRKSRLLFNWDNVFIWRYTVYWLLYINYRILMNRIVLWFQTHSWYNIHITSVDCSFV